MKFCKVVLQIHRKSIIFLRMLGRFEHFDGTQAVTSIAAWRLAFFDIIEKMLAF